MQITFFLLSSFLFVTSALTAPPEILLDWNFNQTADGTAATDGQVIGPDADGVHRDIRIHDASGHALSGTAVHRPKYARYEKKEISRPGADGWALRTGEGSAGLGNLASLDAITHSNTSFSVWTRVKFLGQSDPKNNDVILGRPGRWYLTRQVVRNRLMVNFQAELFDRFPKGEPSLANGVWYDLGLSFEGNASDNLPDILKVYLNGKLADVFVGVARFDERDFFHVGAGGMSRLASDALFDRVIYWRGVADEETMAGLSGVPKAEIVHADNAKLRKAMRRAKWERAFGTFHDAPLDPGLLAMVRQTEGLSPEGVSYLEQLRDFRRQVDQGPTDALGAAIQAFRRRQLESLPAVVYFTRHPLSRPNAANCAIWQSRPEKWGCAIKAFNPKRPEEPAKTIFSDADGSIYDMTLSFDGKTVFFSHCCKSSPNWQIHEIGVEGKGLKKISRDAHFHETSAEELPNGRLVFVSTRREGFTVCQPGPTSNLYTMNRDGSDVRCVSQNTLTDFSPHMLPDGRILFTRWEYIDRDLTYRQSLWTQNPDGSRYQLFFGNTVRDVGTLWQCRPVPGHGNLLVSTFAPHHGWPHGAIGWISNRQDVEAPRGEGFAYLTHEFKQIADTSYRWGYRDPAPIDDYRMLVAFGGGDPSGLPPKRFAIYLLDVCGNRIPVAHEADIGCYNPLPVTAREKPPQIAAFPASGRSKSDTEWGTLLLADVYRGLPERLRGRVKYVQVMEQMPKLADLTRRAYDQSPVMSYATYYAKRVWGRVEVEPDGSAHFRAPALREVYLQILDEEGRELHRMTTALQLMPGETQSCIGCHEHRHTAPPVPAFEKVLLASRHPAKRLEPPEWGNGGVFDFCKVVQPVLDKYCVECHHGPSPDGGYDLSGDKTRFFNMAYDNMLGRSRSYRQHDMATGEMLPEEAAKGKPLVHFFWLLRTPSAVNQPLLTGSHASRLLDYIETDHCGRMIPLADRRRIYTWIDANVPYYSTYEHSRPKTSGYRDLCDNPDTGKPAAWFADGFLKVYDKRCASCHGGFPQPNDHANIWDGRIAWINFTHPEWSPALTAHLPKEAGGRGLGTEKGRAGEPLFKTTDDGDYRSMLRAIERGRVEMLTRPRVDM